MKKTPVGFKLVIPCKSFDDELHNLPVPSPISPGSPGSIIEKTMAEFYEEEPRSVLSSSDLNHQMKLQFFRDIINLREQNSNMSIYSAIDYLWHNQHIPKVLYGKIMGGVTRAESSETKKLCPLCGYKA